MRRKRWAVVAVAGATVATAVLGVGAVDAAPPTLTVSASVVVRGEDVTATVTGCSATPVVMLGEPYGGRIGMPSLTEGPAGTWTATIGTDTMPGKDVVDDLEVQARCGLVGETTSAVVDVEDPALRLGPYQRVGVEGVLVPPDPGTATTAFGTDCPPGTTVAVEIQVDDGPVEPLAPPVDAEGDWEVPLPEAHDGARITVTAGCGALVYDPVTEVRRRPASTTTSTSTSTTVLGTTIGTGGQPLAPPAPAPAPAQPRSGRPSYTG